MVGHTTLRQTLLTTLAIGVGALGLLLLSAVFGGDNAKAHASGKSYSQSYKYSYHQKDDDNDYDNDDKDNCKWRGNYSSNDWDNDDEWDDNDWNWKDNDDCDRNRKVTHRRHNSSYSVCFSNNDSCDCDDRCDNDHKSYKKVSHDNDDDDCKRDRGRSGHYQQGYVY